MHVSAPHTGLPFACVHVCVLHAGLVPAKVRREDQIPWNQSLDGLNHHVGVGN